jgi:RHS repeat-associated protein
MDGQTVLGEYTYNAKGQRVKKVAESTTIYHYDLMGNLIQETDGSGNVVASYFYAGNMRIAKIESSGTIYYYHNDHLGTPLAMTDTSGTIVWKAAYNPFGKAEVDPSSTVTNNFRFPGQYYDAESGLHYNWHRYYDPGTGRYVMSDPVDFGVLLNYQKKHFLRNRAITNPQIQFNPYNYSKNNPIILIDPFGLRGQDANGNDADCENKLNECTRDALKSDVICTSTVGGGISVCFAGCSLACFTLTGPFIPLCLAECSITCTELGEAGVTACQVILTGELAHCSYEYNKCKCPR